MSSGPPVEQPNTAPRATRLIEEIGNALGNQQRERRQQQNNLNQQDLNPRDRLFHALFIKIGLVYSRIVPKRCRVILELIVLMQGLFLFSFLSYLHFKFAHTPTSCLNLTKNSWPRDGILQVRIQQEIVLKTQLPRFYSEKYNSYLFHPCHNQRLTESRKCKDIRLDMKRYYIYYNEVYKNRDQCFRMNLSDFMFDQNEGYHKDFESYEYVVSDRDGKVFHGFTDGDIIKEYNLLSFYERYLSSSEPSHHYVFEYAKEFGLLRLSQKARNRFKIPVKVISLDPDKEDCFGDVFSRYLMKNVLGYDDILMNSIKTVADAENNSGYMLNVVTGDHYKFVSWGIGRGSYLVSLTLMFLFTVSISTLLRYSHQQVFYFILRMLQMMDRNVMFAFPIAPLFTVVLSLVGMETIMSEYFNDTKTSFYIILIVWAGDQFDTICCHTTTSQKHWPRYFFLYHFLFYAYHYRFNGQYSALALAATWFLIQHSMLYFFHNYELPAIEHHLHRNEETYLDEAVQILVEGIEEFVAGQQDQQEQEENPTNDNQNDTTNRERGRIFIFAVDRSIIRTMREFIRHFRQRVLERRNQLNQETIDSNEIPANENEPEENYIEEIGDLNTSGNFAEETTHDEQEPTTEQSAEEESDIFPVTENKDGHFSNPYHQIYADELLETDSTVAQNMSNENQGNSTSNLFAYTQELKENKKTHVTESACDSHVSVSKCPFDQSDTNSEGNHISHVGLTSKEIDPQLSDTPTSNPHDGSL